MSTTDSSPTIIDRRVVELPRETQVILTSFQGDRHLLTINTPTTQFTHHLTTESLSKIHEILGGR